jgi:hypothetical protein
VPRHVFDFWQIPNQEVTATDLLTDEQQKWLLYADRQLHMEVPAKGGRVYKILL